MKKFILGVAALGFMTTYSIAQTKTPIKLTTGQKFVVESKTDGTSSTEVQGQNIDTKMNVSNTYNIEVKNKTANYQLVNTITQMKMNMSMMGREINFDSNDSNDMNGEIGQGLKDFINKPNEIEMTETGDVIEKKTADTTAKDGSPIAQQMRQLESSGFGTTLAFQSLPVKPKVGATWTDNTKDISSSKSITYTIKEISGDIATINFNGTTTTDLNVESQGMEVKTKMTGKVSGEETVDIKTGVILTNTTTTDQTGTVNAMGMEMPTSGKATVITTVKKI